jgi:phosphonate transport system substrate-binding protein
VRKKFIRLASLAVILSAFGCIIYYLSILTAYNQIEDRYKPSRWVTLDPQAPPAPAEPRQDTHDSSQLRIAVAPIVSPAKTLAMYTDFAEYLGTALSKKAVLILRNSYAEVNDLIRHYGCDLAFVCTYSFVQGERDYGLQLLVTPVIKGKSTYQCYIITQAGEPYKTLLDLRGKRFGSSDILSTSGWLYPAVRLLRNGENPNAFFSEHVITGSHDSTIAAVATRYVDGAAVQSLVCDVMVQEDPELARKLVILERSPEYGMPPVVVHPRIEPGLKNRLFEVLLHMHETAQGRKILATLGIDRYVPPDSALYNPVRDEAAIFDAHR